MRCYNGCPDSKMQAYLDKRNEASREIKELYPEAHCTYCHPHDSGWGWQWHIWGKPLGKIKHDFFEACESVKEKGDENDYATSIGDDSCND